MVLDNQNFYLIRGSSLLYYTKLFKRAQTVLKTRYRIDLVQADWKNVSSWLKDHLIVIKATERIKSDSELHLVLESLRRQNPTKFYLLEQDLIKEFRRRRDKLKKIPVKNSIPKIGIIEGKQKKKDNDKKDEDKEAGDYIYIR